jgi:methyl-accepting chemotaxis protein
VVAAEVKTLAGQTARATGEIAEQIAVIRDATRLSVETMAGTGRAIGEISGLAQSVAAAVDEQTSVTGQISVSAGQTAANAGTVSKSLQLVEQAIRQTHGSAGTVFDISRQLQGRAVEFEAALETLFRAASAEVGLRKFTDLASGRR